MQALWGIFKKPIKYVNFEDVQYAIKNPGYYVIINTLPIQEQKCLIRTTINYDQEENLMNQLLSQGINRTIIVYGRNDLDITVDKKYQQLLSLGFVDIYIYRGGLFEWLLLQDIYGNSEFNSTSKILDILKYRQARTLGTKYLL